MQSWEANLRTSKALPRELREMFQVGKKFGVRLDALKLPYTLKLQLPIWYHIGAESSLGRVNNSPASKCLRNTHNVKSVEDVMKVTDRIYKIEPLGNGTFLKHQRRKNCKCKSCREDRTNGCQNPEICTKTAEKLLTLVLFPKYSPFHMPHHDGLSLTPNRKEANVKERESNGKIHFDPTLMGNPDIEGRKEGRKEDGIFCPVPNLILGNRGH